MLQSPNNVKSYRLTQKSKELAKQDSLVLPDNLDIHINRTSDPNLSDLIVYSILSLKIRSFPFGRVPKRKIGSQGQEFISLAT